MICFERVAGHVLHHDEEDVVLLLGGEHGDDVRMAEAGEQARLAQQLAEVEVLPVRNLERDLLVDPRVFREIDAAKAAAAEGREDAVLPDGLSAKEHLCAMSILSACVRASMCPALDCDGRRRVELPDDEAEHLVRVLRLGVGDRGRRLRRPRRRCGAPKSCRSERRSASVRLLEPRRAGARARHAHHAGRQRAQGRQDGRRRARRGDAGRRPRIQPLVSERTEIGLAAMARSQRVARWQRIAVASAKQCGRAVVPAVHDAAPLDWYWNETDLTAVAR